MLNTARVKRFIACVTFLICARLASLRAMALRIVICAVQDGMALIHKAVVRGQDQLLEVLLARGAAVDLRDGVRSLARRAVPCRAALQGGLGRSMEESYACGRAWAGPLKTCRTLGLLRSGGGERGAPQIDVSTVMGHQ